MNKVHISKMTGKLQGLQAISTNTVTNKFCTKMNASKNDDVICKHCYSHSMLNTYRKNMQNALQRNSDALSIKVLEDENIPRINQLYMRFNAHGELINETHLVNLVKICMLNPNVTFALWTKRKDIVIKYFVTDTLNNDNIPDNIECQRFFGAGTINTQFDLGPFGTP